jgi:hypothetical protein
LDLFLGWKLASPEVHVIAAVKTDEFAQLRFYEIGQNEIELDDGGELLL